MTVPSWHWQLLVLSYYSLRYAAVENKLLWTFPGDISSVTAPLYAGSLLFPWPGALFILPGVSFDLFFLITSAELAF